MIINELAYKVTLRADEFLNGKRKLKDEVAKLNKDLSRADKEREKELKKQREEFEKFGKSATSAFRNVTTAAAGFLGIGAGLYGIKQLFTSTADEIVRASQQAKFFGSDVNKVFGVRRGFQQAGLNADAFIGASGNARMALANIKDPTIFGGLTGAAQNLMTLGARTGLNINQLGDPNKALGEFTRYGKSHSQENLMQVMAAAGFDPTDAAKIKSGELKSLVDSETKKSNITAAQVKEQENLLVKMGELSGELGRLQQGLAMAFAPDVIDGMKAFGNWMEHNSGDVIGFFTTAGAAVKSFTEAVGGAENALTLLAALYLGSKIPVGGGGPSGAGGGKGGTLTGVVMERLGLLAVRLSPYGAAVYSKGAGEESQQAIFSRTGATWQNQLLDQSSGAGGGKTSEPEQHAQSTRRNLPDRNNNPGNLRPVGGGGFRQYLTEDEGWEALSRQLGLYYTGRSAAAGHKKLQTLRDIISTYAPPTENDTEKYISTVAGWMGVNPEQRLDLDNPAVMAKLRSSMARYEGATNWQNGISAEQMEQYRLQIQYAYAPTPPMQSVDKSHTSSVHINTVEVKTNPQTVDALADSAIRQAKRSSTNAAFSSSVK